MISEGSCDTKDWSNDAEKSALLHSRGFQTVFEPLWPKVFTWRNPWDFK